MSKITDNLYLGDRKTASNLKELRGLGISHIVNTTDAIPNYFPKDFEYIKLGLIDEPKQNICGVLEPSYKFIKNAIDSGGIVFVHCFAGISRSSSTVIYYLMRENDWSFDFAKQYVKFCRPQINPNRGFENQLRSVFSFKKK